MTGGDCLESVKSLRKNVNNIMLEFGMPLRKWCSNEKSVLEGIDEQDIEINLHIEAEKSNSVKTLGVIWNPKLDELGLRCKWEPQGKITKRSILSEVSRLFDPLGLVGPVIVTTKILLQDLWKLQIDWDEQVPEIIRSKWGLIRENLCHLNNLKVPRHIICVKPTQIELHFYTISSFKIKGSSN